MDLKGVGIRLKECRRKNHLTQEEFAELVEVSPHYIYEIERGLKAMSLHTLDKIVTALGVSTDYLLYDGKTPVKNESDQLSVIVENLPLNKRESVAEIISVLLPYMK